MMLKSLQDVMSSIKELRVSVSTNSGDEKGNTKAGVFSTLRLRKFKFIYE